MFAIVSIGSKQFKVAKGDVILVDKLAGLAGETLTFDNVLLVAGEGKAKVGTPTVKGAKITAKILAQEKGEKIDVRRYKSKVRERRHVGFRPLLTRLEILEIA